MTSDESIRDPIHDPVPADDAPIARPEVADHRRRNLGVWGYGVAILAGGGVLFAMTTQREMAQDTGLISSAQAAPVRFGTPAPLPADLVLGGATAMPSGVPAIAAPQFSMENQVETSAIPSPAAIVGEPAMTTPVSGTAVSRAGTPAMVVDLSETPTGPVSAKAAGLLANPALAGMDKPGGIAGMDRSGETAGMGDEVQFAQRAGAPSESARATRIGKMDAVIAEGTVISATLETAINSDLPGFARAVIARDVTSFDGTRLLIPRGSRVVGQYKSGVALGGSRVFVIWTRIIRPDGVTVQLASPGGDDLGRGGLSGKVERHFFQQFGGSILTSVLNGAVALGTAALGGGVPVYINSVAQAGAAGNAAGQTGGTTPTIKTPQGLSIKIFVARDLDFSETDKAR